MNKQDLQQLARATSEAIDRAARRPDWNDYLEQIKDDPHFRAICANVRARLAADK